MNYRTLVTSVLAIFFITLIGQQPVFAKHSHKHHRHSSHASSKESNCRKVKKILRKIDRTTTEDLAIDKNTNSVVQQTNQTVNNINATTEEILGILETPCINFITSVPFEISTSGYYRLACDLVFNPTVDGTNAITIDPNVRNVNLDFANHTLKMVASSTTADNNGILINSGCRNIVIHDGTVQGFSASQIRGYASLNTIEVQNMILEGIPGDSGHRMVNETFASGVNFGAVVETLSFVPTQTEISNNIKLTNLIIRGIQLENLSIADQSAWGVALFYCNNIEMDNVHVRGIRNNGLIDGEDKGNVNTSAFGLNFCTNSVSRFCTGNDVLALSPDFGGLVDGDAIGTVYVVCDRTENYDCSYSNNVGTRRCGGIIWVSSNDFLAERCFSDSNRVIDPLAVGVQSHYGFEAVAIATSPQRGIIKDCHVVNQPTAFIANGATDIIFVDCTAIAGNLVPSPAFLVEGFQSSGSDGVTFKNCIATGFIVQNPNPFHEAGFRIRSGSTNINVIGCKSSKNSIGIFVEDGSTNVVVDSNEVAFNTQFGILDTTPVQTPNLYIRNVAFANPVNYSVNTSNANFAIVQASQSAGFPLYTSPHASPLSNFDLQP